MRVAAAWTRGAGCTAPAASNEASDALGTHAFSLPLFASSVAFQTVSTGPFASVPPMRKMPSPATTTAAPARGAGSFRSVDSVQAAILPVATSGVPAKTWSVGAPSPPRPPMTYATPEKKTADAWARAAGRAAPWLHTSRLPSGRRTVAKTVFCGVPVGPVPPTRSVWRPAPTIAASARASGSASSAGLGSQGRTVPAGAGHGTVRLEAGQKLIGVRSTAGLNTLSDTPRSIVFCTVAYRARSGRYAINIMMRTNQTIALTPAQPQPFASSSPKKARLRATVPPGTSASAAIYCLLYT